MPPRTLCSKSVTIDLTRALGASSSRIDSARSSGSPASNRVASCCVIASRSPWRTRPEPSPSDSPLARARPAVHAQGHHAVVDRVPAQVARGPAAQDEAARVLRDREELVDPHAAAITGGAAVAAPLAPEQRRVGGGVDAERFEVAG